MSFRWFLLLVAVAVGGCSRSQHVRHADGAAFHVLGEKTKAAPWRLPAGYQVLPDPRSRFFDDSGSVDPKLPVPAPDALRLRPPRIDPPAASRAAGGRPGDAAAAQGAAASHVFCGEIPQAAGPERRDGSALWPPMFGNRCHRRACDGCSSFSRSATSIARHTARGPLTRFAIHRRGSRFPRLQSWL